MFAGCDRSYKGRWCVLELGHPGGHESAPGREDGLPDVPIYLFSDGVSDQVVAAGRAVLAVPRDEEATTDG